MLTTTANKVTCRYQFLSGLWGFEIFEIFPCLYTLSSLINLCYPKLGKCHSVASVFFKHLIMFSTWGRVEGWTGRQRWWMFPIIRLNKKPFLKHGLRLEASRGGRLYPCHLISQKSWRPQSFLLLLNWIWQIIIFLWNILQIFKCKIYLFIYLFMTWRRFGYIPPTLWFGIYFVI